MSFSYHSALRHVLTLAQQRLNDQEYWSTLSTDERHQSSSQIQQAQTLIDAMQIMLVPDLSEIPRMLSFDAGKITDMRPLVDTQRWLTSKRTRLETQRCAGLLLEIFYRLPVLTSLSIQIDRYTRYDDNGESFEATSATFSTRLSHLPPFPLVIGNGCFNPEDDLQDITLADVELWLNDALEDEELTEELAAIHHSFPMPITIERNEVERFLPSTANLWDLCKLIESKKS